MALATLTLACLLLYATSKYFPIRKIKVIDDHRTKVILLAGAISLFSLYLFSRSFDFSTALMVWTVAFMTLLSAVILSVKMNAHSIWVWGGLCFLFILIELI